MRNGVIDRVARLCSQRPGLRSVRDAARLRAAEVHRGEQQSGGDRVTLTHPFALKTHGAYLPR
jgi:hypothetical protein